MLIILKTIHVLFGDISNPFPYMWIPVYKIVLYNLHFKWINPLIQRVQKTHKMDKLSRY